MRGAHIFCLVLGVLVVLNAGMADGADTIKVSISSSTIPNVEISPYFAGFSYEVSGILDFTGRYPATKSSFVQLLNNLRLTENTLGPNIRVGGNSADESWWNPDGKPNPPGVTYSIKPLDLQSYQAVVEQTNSTLVIDTNMRQSNSAQWAVDHIKGVQSVIGFNRVARIEIGNEPDLFSGNGIRPHNWTFDNYVTEYNMYVKSLYSAIPNLPLPIIQSAVFCCEIPSWDSGLPSYINNERDNELTVCYHRYPLNHCGSNQATLYELLQDKAAAGQAAIVQNWVQDARKVNRQFVVGETNSVACGGQNGVSDVMGTTLWAVDYMFNLAAVGVESVNFHGGLNNAYTAISYPSASSNAPEVRPLYYAMWMFALATNNSAQIARASVSTNNNYLKAWVTRTQGIGDRVVVIHKDVNATSAATVTVNPNKVSGRSAKLMYLSAKGGATAEYGLSLGSVTFDGNVNGRPVGNFIFQAVNPNSQGDYVFKLEPATIAYLELPM